MPRLIFCSVIASALSVAMIRPAYAYLDPGTGSIILQATIGAVAGAMVLGRTYLYRVRSWLSGLMPARTDDQNPRT